LVRCFGDIDEEPIRLTEFQIWPEQRRSIGLVGYSMDPGCVDFQWAFEVKAMMQE
jgi:hypothetical protein